MQMKTDNLYDKKISLGKCVINATNTPGIYRINDIATVAAIGPNSIITGEENLNGDSLTAELNSDLLDREVALTKEFVLGNIVAYKISDLAHISLPRFLDVAQKIG